MSEHHKQERDGKVSLLALASGLLIIQAVVAALLGDEQ